MKKRYLYGLLSLIVLGLSILLPYLMPDQKSHVTTEAQPESLSVEQHIEYGINCDSLRVEKGIVRQNQSLSEILSFYDIGSEIIHQIASLSRPVFDVRKMRVGNPYTVLMTKDTVPEVVYFIYEEDAVSYVTYQLKDELKVNKGAKELTREISTASGVIESSLWNSLAENGKDPTLANEMSEVYAWTIDFFGIQKGDYYKVIYEELKVEGKPIGIGNVIAACFHHMGSDLYAFRYTSNGETGYYDQKGENLQRAFLKAPLRFKRISSKFSHGRMHPILKIRRPHLGIDYAADYGTPVQTIGDGTVIEKGWNKGGGGNYIKIKHNGAYTTLYMHLAGFAKGISTGTRVRQGDVIGYVGSTGLSTGPHLDFRVFLNGSAIDPLKMESPPSEPVAKEYLPQYLPLVDSLKTGLDTLKVIRAQQLIVNR
ncbi:MAG TPA: peptidoglycan DD-metalloendopeptidase family protein [Bacteroidales bacterium]|nr:peptidoglycan DD-metalloendopeptidase family protein [Bacteroidales bacterium]HNQ82646.1 peptidoglycan DD-metalloendopeptidase family protein [Bacteroidales bacterium]